MRLATEVATPSSVYIAACSLNMATVYTHVPPFYLTSGTGGLQEAINAHSYDEVIPIDMEQWRVDYRRLSEERQMIAASIIWLYRARKDNIWLRRVACTWHAADAIAALSAAGALEDWARLYALYPGW